MRGRRRVDHQRLGVADVGQVAQELAGVDELFASRCSPLHAKREDARCAGRAIHSTELLLREVEIRRIRQTGVIDPRHLRVALQKLRHRQRVAAVLAHAQVQGFGALQQLPSVHGREHAAKGAVDLHARLHGVAKVAKGLIKLHAVVRAAGLHHLGELAVVPGELATLHHHAAHGRAVAADVFGGAVHHDVGAQRQRVAQVRAGHGVVNDERHAVRMRHLGHGRDVEHVDQRVADGLAVHSAGVGAHGACKVFGVERVHKRGLDAQTQKAHAQLPHGAAVERAGCHDVVPGFEDGQQRRHLRGHAAGAGERGAAVFEAGHALLQHRHRGIADAAVDVAKGLQVEQAAGVLGVVEHKAGRLVDGRGARAGHRVGLGACVDGAGAKAEVAVGAVGCGLGHGGGAACSAARRVG